MLLMPPAREAVYYAAMAVYKHLRHYAAADVTLFTLIFATPHIDTFHAIASLPAADTPPLR